MPTPRKNRAASALGKLARGKRKKLTPAALLQRRSALAKARERRHPKPLDEHDFQLPPGPVHPQSPDDLATE